MISKVVGGHINVADINAQSISNQGGAISLTADRGINTQGNIETNDNSITFDGPTNLQANAIFSVQDDLAVTGDSNITFEQTLNGNHNLTLNATTVNLNNTVGNTDPLNQLTVHGTLTNTTPKPTQITIHQTIQTDDITSQDAIHLQSLNADIHTGTLTSPQAITLDGQNIHTGNIHTDSQLTITSPQTLTTGNITTPSLNTIQTQGNLTTGHITSQNPLNLTTTHGDLTTGNLTTPGNDIHLKGPKAVRTGFINTTHPTHGGNAHIDGGQTVQIDGSFTNSNGINASLSTVGGSSSGSIEIHHGGDGVVPFRVGDASVNGSSAAITRGTHNEGTINTGNDYQYTHRQDQNQIAIISRPAPPVESSGFSVQGSAFNLSNFELTTLNSEFTGPPLESLAYLIGRVLGAKTTISRDINNDYAFAWEVPGENPGDESTILNANADAPELGLGLTPLASLATLGIGLNSDDLASDIDQFLEEQYEDYFDEDVADAPVTTASIRQMLTTIEQQTNQRSVILYALNRSDALELLLMVPDRPPIPKTIPLITQSELRRNVSRLRRAIARTTNTSYLDPAQKLYDWLIRPYESELEGLGVDTIIFGMDVGLRSIPLAALHDGEQFLIETYSLGMIPSVSLTNSNYQALHNTPVLAMGASEFRGLNPLPAVPLELAMIQQQGWGQAYLNEAFTLDALDTQSQNRTQGIVHLATHAKFQAGAVEHSYIQLWDQPVGFDQIRELGWHHKPQMELLVLSACDTALGDASAELGFAGLAVQTGVKSALASLWQVSDLGTLALMTSFYEHLKDTQITTKAEALRQAQLNLLHNPTLLAEGMLGGSPLPPELARYSDADLSHPYYWSSFTLVGSPW
ncbi:MAG: CHAT domain-containing protein [Spirulina sp. SIO3F2]|nr:CHAT domain-containing protein [Spirulina sp. SIO3F2]